MATLRIISWDAKETCEYCEIRGHAYYRCQFNPNGVITSPIYFSFFLMVVCSMVTGKNVVAYGVSGEPEHSYIFVEREYI